MELGRPFLGGYPGSSYVGQSVTDGERGSKKSGKVWTSFMDAPIPRAYFVSSPRTVIPYCGKWVHNCGVATRPKWIKVTLSESIDCFDCFIGDIFERFSAESSGFGFVRTYQTFRASDSCVRNDESVNPALEQNKCVIS